MMLTAILLSAIGAMTLSELLGRGKVVYARVFGLFGSYVLFVGLGAVGMTRRGGGLVDAAALALSVVPLMAAWLGFRIHLTNSITLEMAGLLEDGRARTLQEIARAYDVDGHAARRVAILRASGYLSADEEERLVDSPRSRLVLGLMRLVCGPDGPRMVADGLRNLDAPQRR